MARGGKPRVYIDGDASGVTRAARQAEASLKRLDRAGSKSLGGLSKTAKGLNPHLAGAIAGFTSLAGAAALLKDSVKTTEDLAKGTAMISRTTGESTQEASRWVAVAKVRGLEVTRLNRSFVGLAKAIEGANAGSKKQAELFKDLGISQKELVKGDVSQILGDIADAFAKMPDGAKKAADAQQLFGRGAASILPLLNRGNAALREQLGLSDKYGTTLSKGQLAASLKAAQAQRELNLAMMGLKVQLGQAVIPALTRGVTVLSTFIAQMRSGEGAGGKFAAKVREVWQNVKPTVTALGQLAANVGKFVAQHPGAQKMLAVLVPMGAALKVVGGAGTVSGIARLASSLGSVGSKAGTAAAGASALTNVQLAGWFAGALITARNLAKSGIDPLNSKTITFKRALDFADRQGGALLRTIGRIIPGMRDLGDAIHSVNQYVQGSLGKVQNYGMSWEQVASHLRNAKRDLDAFNNTPQLSPTAPGQTQLPISPDRRRRGGFVFQRGGTVPALVSSGEVIVEPGGGAWQAPGAPVAADNVPAMLRPGSAVLTWDGQARMAAGASLAQAVAMQAPHFRSGGYANWTKVGASVYGGSPGDDNGVGSVGSNLWRKGAYPFAELGWGHSLGGLRDYQKLYIRRGNRAVVGTNEDVGPSYGDRQIDLHKQIAVALGISPTSFLGSVQIMNAPASARPGPVDPRTLTSTGSAAGTPARTVTRTSYAAPSPGTGRVSRSAWDAGWQRGLSDPFGYQHAQDRTDDYNQARARMFGVWTKSTRTIPGRPAHPSQPSTGGGRAGKVVDWAKRQVGYHEGGGNSNKYGPSAPWCGYFVQAGLQQAGMKISSGMGYVPHIRDMISGHAAPFKGPVSASAMQPGDVITWSGHTGIYIGGGQAISGNYGNAVRQHGSTAPGPIVEAGRPAYRRGGRVQRFRRGTANVSGAGGSWSGAPRQYLKEAQDGLGSLIKIGIGKNDEPRVKSALARELRIIDHLDYRQLGEFGRVARNFWSGVRGPAKTVSTVRARVQQLIDYAGSRTSYLITRPVGVADSVEADISDQGGQLPDKLTLGGIDPDSKEGIDRTIDFNNRSITRLWQRRAALREAWKRARRAKRPDVEKRIMDEIKDIDSQVTTFAASNVRLRRARISAPTNAESQAGATGGGGTDPDLQAQLDQANVRATVAQRTAGLSEAFIRTAFGSGDIGRGGSYAWTAAGGSGAAFGPGMSITINTLHPGDSQTLAAIADAATAGMGQQGFVTSPRAVSGV